MPYFLRLTLFSTIFLSFPASAFAAAGFADLFIEHRQWIFPAYAYCLLFGLAILFLMLTMSFVWKTKTREYIQTISTNMIRHRILAIIFCGVSLAIPIGLLESVSWELWGFSSVLPFACVLIAFPVILVVRRLWNTYLLSPFWIKWSLMIALSSIFASLLFIILTKCNILPGTDITYWNHRSIFVPNFHSPSHPYDSIVEIWSTSLFLLGDIAVALLLYGLGILKRYMYSNFGIYGLRKHITT